MEFQYYPYDVSYAELLTGFGLESLKHRGDGTSDIFARHSAGAH